MDKNYTEKMRRFREYIEALEEERRKIQVFRSELPLCLELVTQAIDTWRKQVSGTTMEFCLGQSECSEQISSEGPVLEELFPIKKTSSSNDDEQQSHKPINNSSNLNKDNKNNDKLSTKSDWLRSVQLWNQTPDQPIKEDTPRKVSVMEVKGNGCGAFQPFKREKIGGSPSLVTPAATASSTAETGDSSGGGGSKIEQKGGQSSQRKERRCWSPELHRRFLHSLQQLGGSHVATPKQIRELMKVDGLTNDEVKSHLQKYRLHTRRPSSSNQNNNPQAPQFVVVGGIWVPPPAVAAATTAASGEAPGSVATSSGIYAPIAAPPPPPPPQCVPQAPKQSKQLHSDDRSSHSEGGAHSNSPSTSSSTHTHTTTASSVLAPVV